MNKVDEIVSKIKQDIKKNDLDFYEQLIESNISNEYIFKNKHKIYRHLSDFLDQDLEYKLLLRINNSKFVQYEELSNRIQNEVNSSKIKNNFSLKYGFEDLEIIDFSKVVNFYKAILEKANSNKNYLNDVEEQVIQRIRNVIVLFEEINKNKSLSSNIVFEDIDVFNSVSSNLGFTQVILSILNYLSLNDSVVGAISIPLLVSETKQSFQTVNSSNWKTFNRAKNVDILYINELNILYLSDWFIVDYLIPLIDYRYINKKVTIISLRVTFDDFVKSLKYKSSKKISSDVFEELQTKLLRFKNIY